MASIRGRRVGLGDLPEAVLVLIFSFLRGSLLRPLRLVCRSFRQASLQGITGLRLADGSKASVINAMRVFTRITALTILVEVPASSDVWPHDISRLRSLIVHSAAMNDGLQLPDLLRQLSGLTSLRVLCGARLFVPTRFRFQDVVVWCPALRALEADAHWLFTWEPDHCASILQLTLLQELRIRCRKSLWRSLLPCLAGLTLLRALSYVEMDESDDIAPLAALTQLTSLGAKLLPSQWADCLRALTGLKSLSFVKRVGFPLQMLPTSLEGISFHESPAQRRLLLPGLLRRMPGMTRLDCRNTGYIDPEPTDELGIRSLDAVNPWCEGLRGLRHLGLIGRHVGLHDVRLLVPHLTALEHLRLQLELFDGVPHLSALTRLTLLHLRKETRQGAPARALGPPKFLTALQLMRDLRLHWDVTVGEEQETVRCLAELERLHVTLVPVERARGSGLPPSIVGSGASVGRASRRQHSGDTMEESGQCKARKGKLNLCIQLLKPLASLWALQEVRLEGGYSVDDEAWERIQSFRGKLGLPVLTSGSLFTYDVYRGAFVW